MRAAIAVTTDNVESAIQENDIVSGKIDTEVQRELAAAFQTTSIPTLVATRDRTIVFSQPGALPTAALAEVIAQVRALDTTQRWRQARGHTA